MKRLHFIVVAVIASVSILAIASWWRTRTDQSTMTPVDQAHQVLTLEDHQTSPLLETNDQGWLNDRFWSIYIVADRPQLKHKVVSLRSLGFPEHCINGLIKAEIDLRYAGAVSELRHKLRSSRMTGSDLSLGSEVESLFRKKNIDYESATGASLNRVIEIAALEAEINSPFTDIDPDRAQQIGEVLEKYRSVMETGVPDVLEFKRLLAERDLEMAGILTPEEKRQFDLVYSMSGPAVRGWAKNMNLSEDQFNAMFDIQKAFDDGISSWQLEEGQTADLYPDDFAERLRERDEQLAAALGEEDYAQFKKVSDPYFPGLDRWATGQQLPNDVVDAVYNLRQEVGDAYVQHIMEGAMEGAARTEYQNSLIEYSRDALQGILGEWNVDYDIGSPPFDWIVGITNNIVPVIPGR